MDEGGKIRFWENPWLEDIPLAKRLLVLYRMSNFHNKSIHCVRLAENFIGSSGYSWNLSFVRNLNELELERVSMLIMILDSTNFCEAMEDRRVWKLENFNVFSCRSLFKELTTIDGSLHFQHYSFV